MTLYRIHVLPVLYRYGYLGDPGVDGRIILRWIFGKWDVGWGYGLDRAGLG